MIIVTVCAVRSKKLDMKGDVGSAELKAVSEPGVGPFRRGALRSLTGYTNKKRKPRSRCVKATRVAIPLTGLSTGRGRAITTNRLGPGGEEAGRMW
jgi:hypothetical protein